MNNQPQSESCLSAYRVLDLAQEECSLCAKILADLGADVIKVERPGGDPSRNLGPFYHDIPDPQKSLFWFTYNANKRGITLDLETADGKDIFLKLVKSADFVIESFPPGYMDRLSLGYPQLSQCNPRTIMTSITPFGQTGPYKDYKSSDIVSVAMGGHMYVTGDADRPPVRVSIPQAAHHASAHAAAGTLIAHYHREVTGEGQHVDVSMQEAVSIAAVESLWAWDLQKLVATRSGARARRLRRYLREVWSCQDGEVCFRLMGGTYGRATGALVEWMKSQGAAGILAEVRDWEAVDLPGVSQEQIDSWEEVVASFFRQRTVAEIYEEAVKRNIYLLPSYSTRHIAEYEQLAARDFWVHVEHPELGTTITYPGAPYKFSQTPVRVQRRAPLIGEHNEEIYEKELGYSRQELVLLKEANVI